MIITLNTTETDIIKAQQYIQDAYVITKELIENALDANATDIVLNIDDESIMVKDNGDGIPNLDLLFLEGCTSKKESTEHVLGIAKSESISYGFRGQAISAISSIADIEVLTNYKKAVKINNLDRIVRPAAREIGTTVKVKNIFKNCDIRRKIYKKEIQKHIPKILKLIKMYCLVNMVSFTFSYKKKTWFEKGTGNIEDKLDFEISKCIKIKNDSFNIFFMRDGKGCNYTFFHKRPVYIRSFDRTIQRTLAKFQENKTSYVLLLKCEGDVNVEIDKSNVIVHREADVLSELRSSIDRAFIDQEILNVKPQSILSQKPVNIDRNSTSLLQKSVPKNLTIIKAQNKDQLDGTTLINKEYSFFNPHKKANISDTVKKFDTKGITCADNCEGYSNNKKIAANLTERENISEFECFGKNLGETSKSEVTKKIKLCDSNDEETPLNEISSHCQNEEVEKTSALVDYYQNIFSSSYKPESVIIPAQDKYKSMQETVDFIITANKLDNDFSISKQDFENMTVIGQFNNGFILTNLRINNQNCLFIIDQHAADEITNYEFLQDNFHLKKQSLIVPVKLKTNSIDEYNIKTHKHVLKRNGFDVNDDFCLTAVPVYKNYIFTSSDFWDLLNTIKTNKNEKIIFSTKMKEIMASKACRSSIMVGDALRYKEMVNVVRSLAKLNIPWKCPHGRPVIRLLLN